MTIFKKMFSKESSFKNLISSQLCSRTWIGAYVEAENFAGDAESVFGERPKLSFNENGSCKLEMRKDFFDAKWEIKEDKLLIYGNLIRCDGVLILDDSFKELESFILSNLDGYQVQFFSNRILNRDKYGINKEISPAKRK